MQAKNANLSINRLFNYETIFEPLEDSASTQDPVDTPAWLPMKISSWFKQVAGTDSHWKLEMNCVPKYDEAGGSHYTANGDYCGGDCDQEDWKAKNPSKAKKNFDGEKFDGDLDWPELADSTAPKKPKSYDSKISFE